MQNPEKLVKYLGKVSCHTSNSRETQIIAMCWDWPRRTKPFNVIHCPQVEEVSGSDNKTVGALATPAAVTGFATEPEEQPVLVSVPPTHKQKYWMQTSACLVRKETPSKKGKEEEVDEEGYSRGPS